MKSQAPLAPAEVAQSVESFVSVNRPVKSAALCDELHFLHKCRLVAKTLCREGWLRAKAAKGSLIHEITQAPFR